MRDLPVFRPITATTIANPADEKQLNSSSVKFDDFADFSPPKIGELANFNFGSNPKSFDKIHKKTEPTYRISANSFRGNYSFLNLSLCSVTFGHST